MAGLALLIVIAVLVPAPGEQSEATGFVPGPSPAPVPTTAAKGSLVAPIPVYRTPGDPDWLTAAPHGLSWQRVEGVPLLFTASDGPTRLDGAVAAGYSHTPQGAVVAALQISMRILYSPDYVRILDTQAAISDIDRRQILAARSTQPRLDPTAVAASTVQPVGFKIGTYTTDAATIYYAYPRASGAFRIARQTVVWREGDWRYSSELTAPALPEMAELTGFTLL